MATQLGEAFVKITTRLTSLRKGLFDANKLVATAARNMGATLSLAVSAPLALMAKNMIDFAGDAEDSEARFRQVMGSMSGSVREWSKELNRAIGISEFHSRKVVTDFTSILLGSELSREEAVKYSKALVELAADMRAATGGPLEQALGAVRSALAKMPRPLRNYGIVLEQMTSSGDLAADSIKTMDAILKKADIQGILGQAAREADNFTGVLVKFNGAVRDINTIFGNAFLPAVTKAIKLFTSIVGPIAKFVGEILNATKIAKLFVGALGGLIIIVGPLLFAVGQMAFLFVNVKQALALLTGQTDLHTSALLRNTAASRTNTVAISQGALMMGGAAAATGAATAQTGIFSTILAGIGLAGLSKWIGSLKWLGRAMGAFGIALRFTLTKLVPWLLVVDLAWLAISSLYKWLFKTEEQAKKTADALAKVAGGPGAGFGGEISRSGIAAIGSGGFAAAFAPTGAATAASTGGKEVPRKAVVGKLDQIIDVLQQGVMLPMRLPLL